jgi:rfaE bifunctional protein nucleotidyltransferase chain/domain
VQKWRKADKQIVFTNGCFDILHYGHLHYLSAARDLGDRLIVGVNSAASVTRLKGPNRPIQDEHTRAMMMASLSFIDLVIFFEDDTPLSLIQSLMPDILVKGGDYTIENIVGADIVIKNGGKVTTLPFVDGYSTSLIEQKIKQQ